MNDERDNHSTHAIVSDAMLAAIPFNDERDNHSPHAKSSNYDARAAEMRHLTAMVERIPTVSPGLFRRPVCETPVSEIIANLGKPRAPSRATTLPADAKARKTYPIASGVLDYFPDAIAAVAHLSYVGNEQHNPGQPLHWDRSKSTDEADTMLRHFLQRGTFDNDGIRHSAKMAWRALAILQKEIESEIIYRQPEAK